MIENINLKDYPQVSGVYWFICNDEIVYIGSSSNLNNRMRSHKSCIRKGSHDGKKQDMYTFLQENQFEIQFQLTEKYADLEKQLMEKHKPIFNERYTPFSEEAKKARYLEQHRRSFYKHKHKHDFYMNQLCNYNGEILKLNALSARFFRQGIHHPCIEAKKYLISN
jgi:excinuclease UvrABC nuclease subunit